MSLFSEFAQIEKKKISVFGELKIRKWPFLQVRSMDFSTIDTYSCISRHLFKENMPATLFCHFTIRKERRAHDNF